MIERLHDLCFAHCVLDLVVIYQLLLLHHLESENLAIVLFSTFEHSSKWSFANCLNYIKIFELDFLVLVSRKVFKRRVVWFFGGGRAARTCSEFRSLPHGTARVFLFCHGLLASRHRPSVSESLLFLVFVALNKLNLRHVLPWIEFLHELHNFV